MVKIENISFGYGSLSIFEKINLLFPKGTMCGLCGPNGSGKSTLFELILKIQNPYSGNIYLDGKNIINLKPNERSRLVSYVPQDLKMAYDFSVYETVMMGRFPHIKRFESEDSEDRKIVKEAMELLEVDNLMNKAINHISGGEKQRVFIARALVQDTPLILLDEPTASLDLKHQLKIMEILRKLSDERGITVITILHDLNQIYQWVDYTVLLHKNFKYYSGKTTDILTESRIKDVYDVNGKLIFEENSKPYFQVTS